MKRLFVAVLALTSLELHAQQTPAVELRDAFPADARPDQFALTADGARTYFVNASGEVWLWDRTQKTRARIVNSGPVTDLNVSLARDALAYTKIAAARGDAQVWIVRLIPETGLATGTERRLSTTTGDTPAISPDGKLVAFARDDPNGVGQSVVIVPIAGGAERVVAPSLPSSVGNIRWTPDGKRLYFGVNQPVACVPDWSCLPLAGANRQPPGSIRHVAVSGGAVTTVALARGVFPGLSPDGTTLMYSDTGAVRRWVVADADGKRREVFTLPTSQAVHSWLRGSIILIPTSGNARSLRVQSLTDGAPHTLMDGADLTLDPQWSPDGKSFSLMARGGPRIELRILNADGSLQKSLTLPDNFASGSAWSPDQKFIVFTGYAENTPPHLSVVEVATGRVQRLYDVSQENATYVRWLADSRSLVVSELKGGTGRDRVASFRELDIAGKATLLGEVAIGPAPSGAIAVDATNAIVLRARPADVRLVKLSGDTNDRARERVIVPERAGQPSMPSLSVDGTWLVLRRTTMTTGSVASTALELARVEGGATTTIPLSFTPVGGSTIRVVPGGKDVVVTEARRSDGDPGVYVVSAGTSSIRRLFTYAPQFGPPEFSISPDGRTLLYLLWQSLPPMLSTMDVAAGRSGAAR